MKKALFLLLILITLSAGAQMYLPIDSATGKVTYTDIVEVNNTKEALFNNAKAWVAKTYGDYKSVVQVEDKDAGRIILKGMSNLPPSGETRRDMKYIITVDCKDSKYRCIITDIYWCLNLRIDREFLATNEYNISIDKYKQKSDSLALHEGKKVKRGNKQDRERITRLRQDAIASNEAVNAIMKSLLTGLKESMAMNDQF